MSEIKAAGPLGLEHTDAAKMLAAALDAAREKSGLSQRALAEQMGYKSSVVISHMASGRAPIPIDRVSDFVRRLELDPAGFLAAVLRQRFPDVDFSILCQDGVEANAAQKTVSAETSAEASWIVGQLEDAAGRPIAEWSIETVGLLREVLSASSPLSRWLKPSELSLVSLAREVAPRIMRQGVSRGSSLELRALLERLERVQQLD